MYRNDYRGQGSSYGGGGYRGRDETDWSQKLTAVDWKKEVGPEVKWPKDQISAASLNRSASEIEKWRQEHKITTIADDVPKPVMKFDETPYPKFVLDSFHRQGFKEPTSIQCQAWGIALLNRDIVGIAKTGSGKTLAFLCPGIMHIMAQVPLQYKDGPIVLVLAPTRELAKQIEDEALKVLGGSRINTVCAYGGTPKGVQLRQFDRGAHIAICCPGRLLDILAINGTNLRRVSYFVMDEADRMLDMGFEPQITSICSQLRPDRQTLMFSATWPREIQAIANKFLKNYVRIHVGSTELLVNTDVTQHFQVIDDSQKFDALLKILHEKKHGKVIIFVATKSEADVICRRLCQERYVAWAIHGDRTQQTRDACLAQFRQSKEAILVATDVAQRGLDVKCLDTVINYDFPNAVEDYVHRVGRTGRAGAKGDAYTFLNHKHIRLVGELIDLLKRTNSNIPADLLELQSQRGSFRGRGFGRNSWGGRGGYGGSRGGYGGGGGYGGYNGGGGYNNTYNQANTYGQGGYNRGYANVAPTQTHGYNVPSSAPHYPTQSSVGYGERTDDACRATKRSRSRSSGRDRRDNSRRRNNRSISPRRNDRHQRRSISPKRSRT